MLDKDRDFILECACGCDKTIIDITLLYTREADYISVTDEQINNITNFNAIFYINPPYTTESGKYLVTGCTIHPDYINIYAGKYYLIQDNKITFLSPQ